MSIKIFGLDPGSRVAGYGVLEISAAGAVAGGSYGGGSGIKYLAHGCIDLMKFSENFADRIFHLGEEMRKLLDQYQPQHIVIEKVFLGRNVDSAFKLGHARGVVLCEARRFQASIHEYAAREVKKGITGKGSSEKEEVQSVLHRLLQIPVEKRQKAFDATDALALAFYHVQKQEQARILGRMREI